MSKNRKEKKPWQGLEHLKQDFDDTSLVQKESGLAEQMNDSNSEHALLKKELVIVTILMSILFLILVGLMVLDQFSGSLEVMSLKISNLLIR